jgi:ferrous iron transport protein A
MTCASHLLSLSEIHSGESAVVRDFSHGMGVVGRLTSLGFTPGVEVQMTQNFGHGPLIVTVRGARVALGRGEAAKICVERRAE